MRNRETLKKVRVAPQGTTQTKEALKVDKSISEHIKLCPDMVIDSKGYKCCIHNLSAPCYCTFETCPLFKLERFFP